MTCQILASALLPAHCCQHTLLTALLPAHTADSTAASTAASALLPAHCSTLQHTAAYCWQHSLFKDSQGNSYSIISFNFHSIFSFNFYSIFSFNFHSILSFNYNNGGNDSSSLVRFGGDFSSIWVLVNNRAQQVTIQALALIMGVSQSPAYLSIAFQDLVKNIEDN